MTDHWFSDRPHRQPCYVRAVTTTPVPPISVPVPRSRSDFPTERQNRRFISPEWAIWTPWHVRRRTEYRVGDHEPVVRPEGTPDVHERPCSRYRTVQIVTSGVLRSAVCRVRGRRGRPADAHPPHRSAIISAAIDTAVSSGVRAPRSRPTARPAGPAPPRSSRSSRSRRCGLRGYGGSPSPRRRRRPAEAPPPAPAHRTSGHGSATRSRAAGRCDPPRLGREVPVRPVHDHLVGVREPACVANTGPASHTVTW